MPLGCHPLPKQDAELKLAEADAIAPDDFYSTTNHRTYVKHGASWIEVADQRMDAVIVVRHGRATCRKLRDVKQDDPIVCGMQGIRVSPQFQERDRLGFAFMTNDVSTERRVEVSASKVVAMLRQIKRKVAGLRSWRGRSSCTAVAWSTSSISCVVATSTCCSQAMP